MMPKEDKVVLALPQRVKQDKQQEGTKKGPLVTRPLQQQRQLGQGHRVMNKGYIELNKDVLWRGCYALSHDNYIFLFVAWAVWVERDASCCIDTVVVIGVIKRLMTEDTPTKATLADRLVLTNSVGPHTCCASLSYTIFHKQGWDPWSLYQSFNIIVFIQHSFVTLWKS